MIGITGLWQYWETVGFVMCHGHLLAMTGMFVQCHELMAFGPREADGCCRQVAALYGDHYRQVLLYMTLLDRGGWLL